MSFRPNTMLNIFKGWFGEKAATFGLWAFLDKSVYHREHDIIVPAPDGTTQVDHVIVSEYGIFVVETKNFQGWIFGGERDATWCQSVFGKKTRFPNPLRQNFRHIKCLSHHLGLDEKVFHSVVFFIGDCELKSDLPPNVMTEGLCGHIESFKRKLLSPAEVTRVVSALKRLKESPVATKAEHVEALRKRYDSTDTCPRCGSKLVERVAKQGARAGNRFLACSGFPKCRYTKAIG